MFVGPSNIISWSLQGSFWSVGGVGNVILHILAATSIFFMPNHCQKNIPQTKKFLRAIEMAGWQLTFAWRRPMNNAMFSNFFLHISLVSIQTQQQLNECYGLTPVPFLVSFFPPPFVSCSYPGGCWIFFFLYAKQKSSDIQITFPTLLARIKP